VQAGVVDHALGVAARAVGLVDDDPVVRVSAMNTSPDPSTATPAGCRPSETTVSARAADPEISNTRPNPASKRSANQRCVKQRTLRDISEPMALVR
jgi:hypothetical protein